MYNARFTRLLLLALLMLAIPAASFAGIFVSITVAPPPLPVYVQPVCPQAGYLWTPGYWAWEDEGYYWVPGTWVPAPSVGVLWTPGYWGWDDGYYRWNGGYWGPHVGFYGGVNYGYGYGGEGFFGGEWRGNGFYYNRAVMNVDNTRISNVYVNKTVIVNNTIVNNVSYNGGTGGTRRAPTATEQQVARERHIQPTREQAQHETAASHNRQLLAKYNGGKPAIAATARPADFSRRSAVPARAAGGRVEPTTLKASARAMPPAVRTASTAPSAATRPGANSPTRDNNHNVPKPPNASGRSPAPAAGSTNNHGANQAQPRPPAASASNRTYGNSGRPNASPNVSTSQPRTRSNSPRTDSRSPSPAAPRMQSQAPQRNAPAPQPRMQSQAPQRNAPAPQPRMQSQAPQRSAPAHAGPTPPHQEKGTPNEREKR